MFTLNLTKKEQNKRIKRNNKFTAKQIRVLYSTRSNILYTLCNVQIVRNMDITLHLVHLYADSRTIKASY